MSDLKLNTFAIISFNKDYISYPKYEYVSDEYITIKNNLNEIDEEKEISNDESSYRFWVMKNNSGELIKVSAAFISDEIVNDTFFGPCDTLEDLNKKLIENNIITVN